MHYHRTSSSRTAFQRAEVTISRYSLSANKRGIPFRSCVSLTFILAVASIGITLHIQYNVKQAKEAREQLLKPSRLLSATLRQSLLWTNPRTNGITIVAACQNAHGKLKTTVPTWLRLPGLEEIIIVDWSSKPPLHYVIEEMDNIDIHQSDSSKNERPKLSVITVQKEATWIPSHAYNIGFQFAKSDRILRIDCDHSIRESFLNLHRLSNKKFFSGSLGLSREDDEVDLQNVLYVMREVLEEVGGYDERIDGHGGEHEDLTYRLIEHGLKRMNINYDTFIHAADDNLPRGDEKTDNIQFKKDVTEIERELNLRLVRSSSPWNATDAVQSFLFDASQNTTVPSFRHANARYVMFKSTSHTPSFRTTTPEVQVDSQKKFILAKFINLHYQVPHCLLELISLTDRLNMLRVFTRLVQLRNGIRSNIQTRHYVPYAMFIFASGSLVDRLMLISSGLSVARQTGRPLFIFWPLAEDGENIISTDASRTSFDKLFMRADLPNDMVVFDNIDTGSSFCKKNGRAEQTQFYSFFHGKKGSAPVIPKHVNTHISIHSNTFIKSESLHLSNTKTMRTHLQSLSVHPDITSKILSLENAGLSNCLGVYIPPATVSAPGDKPGDKSQGSISHVDAIHYFTRVHEAISAVTEKNGPTSKTCVYLDADETFANRLKAIPNIGWLPKVTYPASSCSGNSNTSICFVNDLTRITTLSKTKTFYSPVEDDFSKFVNIFRTEEK